MKVDDAQEIIIDDEKELMKQNKLIDDEKEMYQKQRFGVVVLIGHLFLYDLVVSNIIRSCIQGLLSSIIPEEINERREPLIKDSINEDSVILGLKLIEITGSKLDKLNPQVLDVWIRLLQVSRPLCSIEVQVSMCNLFVLRLNKWNLQEDRQKNAHPEPSNSSLSTC